MEKTSKKISSSAKIVKRLLNDYLAHLDYLEIKRIRNGTRLQHVKWMCIEAIENINDEAKLNRWLGFIQGWLVAENIYSIDECRSHMKNLETSDFANNQKKSTRLDVIDILSRIKVVVNSAEVSRMTERDNDKLFIIYNCMLNTILNIFEDVRLEDV